MHAPTDLGSNPTGLPVHAPTDLQQPVALRCSQALATVTAGEDLGSTDTDAPRRPDFPALRPSKRGRLGPALAAASDPASQMAALLALRADVFAHSSLQPRCSLWRTWLRLCAAWGTPPLPMTPRLVEQVGASLKSGGYLSAAN